MSQETTAEERREAALTELARETDALGLYDEPAEQPGDRPAAAHSAKGRQE